MCYLVGQRDQPPCVRPRRRQQANCPAPASRAGKERCKQPLSQSRNQSRNSLERAEMLGPSSYAQGMRPFSANRSRPRTYVYASSRVNISCSLKSHEYSLECQFVAPESHHSDQGNFQRLPGRFDPRQEVVNFLRRLTSTYNTYKWIPVSEDGNGRAHEIPPSYGCI